MSNIYHLNSLACVRLAVRASVERAVREHVGILSDKDLLDMVKNPLHDLALWQELKAA